MENKEKLQTVNTVKNKETHMKLRSQTRSNSKPAIIVPQTTSYMGLNKRSYSRPNVMSAAVSNNKQVIENPPSSTTSKAVKVPRRPSAVFASVAKSARPNLSADSQKSSNNAIKFDKTRANSTSVSKSNHEKVSALLNKYYPTKSEEKDLVKQVKSVCKVPSAIVLSSAKSTEPSNGGIQTKLPATIAPKLPGYLGTQKRSFSRPNMISEPISKPLKVQKRPSAVFASGTKSPRANLSSDGQMSPNDNIRSNKARANSSSESKSNHEKVSAILNKYCQTKPEGKKMLREVKSVSTVPTNKQKSAVMTSLSKGPTDKSISSLKTNHKSVCKQTSAPVAQLVKASIKENIAPQSSIQTVESKKLIDVNPIQPLAEKIENMCLAENKEPVPTVQQHVTKILAQSVVNSVPSCEKPEAESLSKHQEIPEVKNSETDIAAAKTDESLVPARSIWTLDDFEIGKQLGRGKFGTVFLCRERSTKAVLALKVLYKAVIEKSNTLHLVQREIEIQSKLNHPNILRLHAYFHSDKCVFIVLEHAKGGELYKHLHSQPNKRFSETKAANYVAQLVSAIEYCHAKQVIHRDLKPENILISATGRLKIADFGWSVHTPNNRRMTLCGTLDYLAPEIVAKIPYDETVDNWSLGVLIYEFLSGKPSFETETQQETLKRIAKVDVNFPSHFSPDAKDLITRMLKRKPSDRLPLPQVLKHPWMLRNFEAPPILQDN